MFDKNLKELGQNIHAWRRLLKISSSVCAARAGISRTTLANIEHGTGTTSIANVFSVLQTLGIANQVVKSTYPAETEVGRELIYRMVRNG